MEIIGLEHEKEIRPGLHRLKIFTNTNIYRGHVRELTSEEIKLYGKRSYSHWKHLHSKYKRIVDRLEEIHKSTKKAMKKA